MSNFNHGLRGHETLIRLVGKRRKLTLSTISFSKESQGIKIKQEVEGSAFVTTDNVYPGQPSDVENPLSNIAGHHGELKDSQTKTTVGDTGRLGALEQESGTGIETGVEKLSGFISWVQCPVCEKSIKEDIINSHLDLCLRGGQKDTKRKSKQLTMAQFGRASSVGKLSNSSSPTGLQPVKAEEMQSQFRSESSRQEGAAPVPLAPSSPSIPNSVDGDSGNRIDKGKKDVEGDVKLEIGEDDEGVSKPINLGVHRLDIHTTRMRLRRSTRKEDAGKAIDSVAATVPPPASSKGSANEVLPTNLSRQMDVPFEQGASDASERCKDASSDDVPGQSVLSSYLVSKHCSCHCHLPPLNGQGPDDQMGDRNTLEKEFLDGETPNSSDALMESTEKIDRQLDVGTTESRGCDFAESVEKLTNDKLVEVLHTKIVGRRYNRGTVCKVGMGVTLLREPDNPKDANAIKVVQIETPLTLGHISRDISHHLSSLLDKDCLNFWGSVTALPDQNFGAVPIELHFESKLPKEDFLRLEGAENSLRNAVLAAENRIISLSQRPPSPSVSRYQQNFSFMLQTVLERDSHVFSHEERTFLEAFNSLCGDAQRLFIRLYQRKGPWFRLSTLEYRDVADISHASKELLASGYMTIEDCKDEDLEAAARTRFDVLGVVELREFLCTSLMRKKSETSMAKKEDLVRMAASVGIQKQLSLGGEDSIQSGLTVLQMLAEVSGTLVRVSDLADFLIWRLKRLFFLNGDTDLSAFLVVDMGLVKYPRYKCWRARKIFETRESLLAYEQALEVAQRMDMALECGDTGTTLRLLERALQQMPLEDSHRDLCARAPTFLARFSASYIYRNVCTLGVSILERERRYSEAVTVLKQLLSNKTIKSGRWGYWTVRLSLNLDHLGRKEESLQVAEAGVNDPWIRGGDRVALQRRVVRLGKPPRRWKIPSYAAALKKSCKEVQIQGRPLNCAAGVRSWFYGYDGQQCRVEELALQYFASEEGGGWQGAHCEGGVWMTFFGLLMWDVLFSDVPDVFQTSFQSAPLDLDTEVFYSSRQGLIEAQLAAIAEGDTAKLLARTWTQHLGTVCQGVNWERHSLEELQTIASCIGGPGLSAVCRLLAEDHAGWTAGMPDLLLWRTFSVGDSELLPNVSSDSQLCDDCGCSPLGRASVDGKGNELRPARQSSDGDEKVNSGERKLVQASGTSIGKAPAERQKQMGLRGEAKLVEVKGPRDRLSEQQRAWIWILMNAGLSVEVCKVLEQPVE